VAFLVFRHITISPADREKLAVIERLSGFKYPAQAEQAKPFCTEKGFSLIRALEGFPKGFNLIRFKTNPAFSDVEMSRDSAEEKSQIHVRLVQDNGWKFEDIYINVGPVIHT